MIVLLLFECCHFIWRNEVWVQIISVRWVPQDIIFVSILIGICIPYFIGNEFNCYWGVYLLIIWRIHCWGYYPISVLGSNNKKSTLSIFNIASIFLFKFVTAYILLYIDVLWGWNLWPYSQDNCIFSTILRAILLIF